MENRLVVIRLVIIRGYRWGGEGREFGLRDRKLDSNVLIKG